MSGERLLGMWRIRPEALKKAELPARPRRRGLARSSRGHAPLDVGLDVLPLDGLARWSALDRGDGKPALSPRATVASGVKLSGGTTVAEEAVVLGKAALDGVSVLTRTVVPEGVSLSGVAVSQNLVVDPATGATSLLTDLLPAPGAPRAAGIGSRLAGLVLFLLSLPLWPIAFVWSFVANAGHATRPFSFAGNGAAAGTRATVLTFRFETAIPVFRDLPLLLAVVRGPLALTGVAPLAPEEEANAREPWTAARREAPVGLLARSRMIVPAVGAPRRSRASSTPSTRGPAAAASSPRPRDVLLGARLDGAEGLEPRPAPRRAGLRRPALPSQRERCAVPRGSRDGRTRELGACETGRSGKLRADRGAAHGSSSSTRPRAARSSRSVRRGGGGERSKSVRGGGPRAARPSPRPDGRTGVECPRRAQVVAAARDRVLQRGLRDQVARVDAVEEVDDLVGDLRLVVEARRGASRGRGCRPRRGRAARRSSRCRRSSTSCSGSSSSPAG